MENSKTVLIIDEDIFGNLVRKVDKISKHMEELNAKGNNSIKNKWLTTDEVCVTLNISKRKLQQLRSNKGIKFNKTGKKIYYKSSDIEQYLENANQQ